MNAAFSFNDYRQWHWLWTPFFPVQTGLFLVRYPSDRLQMTQPLYQALMQLRFQSLVHDWMAETTATQQETHNLLCQALQVLELPQEPPQLGDLWVWREEWADSMIRFNSRFFQRLNYQMERTFPFRMHPPIPSEQSQLRSLYKKIKLDEWLSELIQTKP